MSYLKDVLGPTPQSEPLPGQVENSAGGHAWAISDMERLRRFLILGSEGGSYYASQRKLTKENAAAVARAISSDPGTAITLITAVSKSGRAPKNDPAIFALAVASASDDAETRRSALLVMPLVCRTGTHLFTFVGFVTQMRGWGRGLASSVASWYEDKEPDALAYQVVKYRQRDGWSHRDLLRLSHPGSPSAEHRAIYDFICGRAPTGVDGLASINGFVNAQMSGSPDETAYMVAALGDKLPREALRPEHATDPRVQRALFLAGIPMTALIRNLSSMTRSGFLTPMSDELPALIEQLTDAARLISARVHPLSILVALRTYQQGHSERGTASWEPIGAIVDALDRAFYLAFNNVQASGKRIMCALDVSGSMDGGMIAGMPGITPRVGSAAMALITQQTEPRVMMTCFSEGFSLLNISNCQRLDDVMRTVSHLPFSRTDCAAPMMAAVANEYEIDSFVIYTDSETWSGTVHPAEALREYRKRSGIDAKLVVVGMVSNGFSIADPNDAGMLDVVGFDTATPQIIAEFS